MASFFDFSLIGPVGCLSHSFALSSGVQGLLVQMDRKNVTVMVARLSNEIEGVSSSVSSWKE
jgi:dihydroxyacetone kinase DhaKLM complex PTS-EIIA-like component DhaM